MRSLIEINSCAFLKSNVAPPSARAIKKQIAAIALPNFIGSQAQSQIRGISGCDANHCIGRFLQGGIDDPCTLSYSTAALLAEYFMPAIELSFDG